MRNLVLQKFMKFNVLKWNEKFSVLKFESKFKNLITNWIENHTIILPNNISSKLQSKLMNLKNFIPWKWLMCVSAVINIIETGIQWRITRCSLKVIQERIWRRAINLPLLKHEIN